LLIPAFFLYNLTIHTAEFSKNGTPPVFTKEVTFFTKKVTFQLTSPKLSPYNEKPKQQKLKYFGVYRAPKGTL
jgi:hypothetical protein